MVHSDGSQRLKILLCLTKKEEEEEEEDFPTSVKILIHPGHVIQRVEKLMKKVSETDAVPQLRNETSFKLQEEVQLLSTKLFGHISQLRELCNSSFIPV